MSLLLRYQLFTLKIKLISKKRIVASVSSQRTSNQEVIDLTLSDDESDSYMNPITTSTFVFNFYLLMTKGSARTKPDLKINTLIFTNDLVVVKTEPRENDSGSESESLPTPNHLLEYIYKTRAEKLKVQLIES
jgi:hypothetical protein